MLEVSLSELQDIQLKMGKAKSKLSTLQVHWTFNTLQCQREGMRIGGVWIRIMFPPGAYRG